MILPRSPRSLDEDWIGISAPARNICVKTSSATPMPATRGAHEAAAPLGAPVPILP